MSSTKDASVRAPLKLRYSMFGFWFCMLSTLALGLYQFFDTSNNWQFNGVDVLILILILIAIEFIAASERSPRATEPAELVHAYFEDDNAVREDDPRPAC